MRTEAGRVIRLEDYRPSDYLIPATSLTFRLSPEDTEVDAVLTVRRRASAAAATPLVLDGDDLELRHVAIDGRTLDAAEYDASASRLAIHSPPDAGEFTDRKSVV